MHSITAQQSRDSRRELGLSQSSVTKSLGFPRQYLSEFESGFSTRLTDSQLKKLRTFYEEKIAEANSNGEKITLTFGDLSRTEPHQSSTEHFTSQRVTLAVADGISTQALANALDMVQDNDARLAVLLQQAVNRDSKFFGSGEISSKSNDELQEIFGLLSLNYVLYRSLSGWPALKVSAGIEGIETLRDIVFETFKGHLEVAGLIVTPAEEGL